MGRPPIGKRAMTGAERQRRYVQGVRGASSKDTVSAKRIAELERQLAQAQAQITELQQSRQGDGVTGKGRSQGGADQVGTGRRHPLDEHLIASLKAALAQAKTTIKELAGVDVAKLLQQVQELKGERHSLKAVLRKVAKERDQLASQLSRYSDPKYRQARSRARDHLNPKAYATLVKALHPDRIKHCSKDELDEASRIIIQLKPAFTD